MKRGQFAKFVNQKQFGIDPATGLAGYGYDGPYAFPQNPKQGEAGVAAGEPLPYSNPDEKDSKTGNVWVARDSDNEKQSLGDSETKGMGTAVPEIKKPDKSKVKQTNPPHVWPKLKNQGQKTMPENKPSKKMTNEDFLKSSKGKTTGQLMDLIAEDHEEVTPISDLYGNQFTPEPNQTIQYLISVIGNSPRMMDRFVIEIKNRGLMNKFLESMMQHQVAFDGIADLFAHPVKGKIHARQFVQAIHDKGAFEEGVTESVDASPSQRFGTGSVDDNSKGVRGGPVQDGDNFNNKGGGVRGGPTQGKDMFGNTPGTNGSNGGQSPASGDSGMSNPGGQGMPNPNDGMPNKGMPDFGQGPIPKKKMMKADTAAGNLFGAAASFPHLRSAMQNAFKP